MRRAYEHDWREFNALGVPTFQCQVESGMALEPQLESPEPYALNQPPRSFYSSLTQEEARQLGARVGLLCKGKAGFFNDELHNLAAHSSPDQHHLAVFEG